jgi:hypothetical protein
MRTNVRIADGKPELVDHVIGEKALSFADRGWIAAPSLALHALL